MEESLISTLRLSANCHSLRELEECPSIPDLFNVIGLRLIRAEDEKCLHADLVQSSMIQKMIRSVGMISPNPRYCTTDLILMYLSE